MNNQDEKQNTQTTRVKLRLDVKDVVRKRPEAKLSENGESGEASRNGEKNEGKTPEILFEDNHLLVVLKPQNVPTQGDESGDPDLLTELKKYLVGKYNKPGDAYLGLVHRLDRPTGGVMVFAKTGKAASRLSEQLKNKDGDFEKTYLAVTNGRPLRVGEVEHYLVKDAKTNTVTVAPSSLEGAKRAVSIIEIKDERDGLSLVSLKLITGRSHQARVQLKTLGAPIVGDYRYAGDKLLVKSKHLALWAYKLTFAHPVSGDRMTFYALPPDEFPWNVFDIEKLVDVHRPQSTGHYFNG